MANGLILVELAGNILCLHSECPCKSLSWLPQSWGVVKLILVPIPVRERDSSHTWKQTNKHLLVSENSTQSWHHLPGDGIRFHRLRAQFYKTAPHPPTPALLQLQVASPGCYLCLWPTGCRLGFQQPPPTQDAILKYRLLPVFLDWNFHDPLLRAAHRTQRNILLTRSSLLSNDITQE